MDFSQVISTTVYLDNLADAKDFDRVYAQYFNTIPPARTTLQQIAAGDRKEEDGDLHYPDLEQMSLIAIRKKPAQ